MSQIHQAKAAVDAEAARTIAGTVIQALGFGTKVVGGDEIVHRGTALETKADGTTLLDPAQDCYVFASEGYPGALVSIRVADGKLTKVILPDEGLMASPSERCLPWNMNRAERACLDWLRKFRPELVEGAMISELDASSDDSIIRWGQRQPGSALLLPPYVTLKVGRKYAVTSMSDLDFRLLPQPRKLVRTQQAVVDLCKAEFKRRMVASKASVASYGEVYCYARVTFVPAEGPQPYRQPLCWTVQFESAAASNPSAGKPNPDWVPANPADSGPVMLDVLSNAYLEVAISYTRQWHVQKRPTS